MDNMFNDDVPPPDSQSDSHREPIDDEDLPDNDPTRIPSSGLDTVLEFEKEDDNRRKQMLKYNKKALPSYDGFLNSELSQRRIPFHIVRIGSAPWDVEQAYYLALLGARVTCDAIDIFRGRQKPAHVERMLSDDCIRKLKTASGLLVGHMREDARLYARIGLLPINVLVVNGWLISSTKFECTVLVSIGDLHMSCNTAFVLKGSAWKCILADFG